MPQTVTRKCIRARNRDQEASQCLPLSPLKVRYRSQKRLTRNARFASRTVTAKKIWHLCSGCYRFFFSSPDTLFVRLSVSTEPRGLGPGLDRSFRHMSHACSEPRATCSRGHRRLRRTLRIAIQMLLALYVAKYFAVQYNY